MSMFSASNYWWWRDRTAEGAAASV